MGDNQEEKKGWKKAFIVFEADPEALASLGGETFLENLETAIAMHLDPKKIRIRNTYPLNQ